MDQIEKSGEVLELFAVPLFTVDLNLDNEKILSFCLNQKSKNVGRVCSNINGWQSTDINLNKVPNDLKNLFELVEKYSFEFSNFSQTRKCYGLDNAWININRYKDSNIKHCHPSSLFSGVYYVKVPEGSGNIVFENPAMNMMQYDWGSPVMYNKYTSHTMSIGVREGLLLIFPSWLYHYVSPNSNDEERVSIAFNIK